ncbi:hypothetical protein [Bacillus sp. FJAT-44742]|uniref:hypothetical protein n=1 Tax=Bacillus sp. FJAT-44742 TaxID=2014005 RepID=UPI000C2501F5|nr:hypothetical protein [Bacillus sp. FJAT-44742]
MLLRQIVSKSLALKKDRKRAGEYGKMITIDKDNKQITAAACVRCPDPFFQRGEDVLEKVGCCSYSPVFTLFEIKKMADRDKNFFYETIYKHPKAIVSSFSIKIEAEVNPAFKKVNTSSMLPMEKEDTKLSYSTCQFFVSNQGCGLPSGYKTSVCRSFLCCTVEESLSKERKEEMNDWIFYIQEEVKAFNRSHEQKLKSKGWTLQEQPSMVVDYLKSLPDM